jgi:hypothetical protein
MKNKDKFPKTPSSVEINILARRMVPNTFKSHWDHKEQTGEDKGLDMIMELYDSGFATNKKINIQIKGTANIELYKLTSGKEISYNIDIKTFLYALESKDAFFLFLCDINENISYYICLQEYYLMNQPDCDIRIDKNSNSINIHIPINNVASLEVDEVMKEYAYKNYLPRSEMD